MDRYLSSILFAADFSGGDVLTRPSFSLRTARDIGFKEAWLERAIANDPELVMAACREADLTDELWTFWTSQLSVASAGSIDVLLLSESGRIAIVETKLSYNPEARRSVVAQVLEYAIHFPDVPFPMLPPIPEIDGRLFIDRETVQSRIQEQDYLLIIAGDVLDSRAVKLGQSLLGRHLVKGWELALVEVAVFEQYVKPDQRQFLLVPHLRGAIVPEQRQVVRIVIEGDRTRVEVEPTVPIGKSTSRIRQTERELIEQIAKAIGPDAASGFNEFIAQAKDLGIQPEGRDASLSLLWKEPITNNRFTFGSIFNDGRVEFKYVMHNYRRSGLDEQIGDKYLRAVSALLPGTSVVNNHSKASAGWKWSDVARAGCAITLKDDLLPCAKEWIGTIRETINMTKAASAPENMTP